MSWSGKWNQEHIFLRWEIWQLFCRWEESTWELVQNLYPSEHKEGGNACSDGGIVFGKEGGHCSGYVVSDVGTSVVMQVEARGCFGLIASRFLKKRKAKSSAD